RPGPVPPAAGRAPRPPAPAPLGRSPRCPSTPAPGRRSGTGGPPRSANRSAVSRRGAGYSCRVALYCRRARESPPALACHGSYEISTEIFLGLLEIVHTTDVQPVFVDR